jgi:hypothetical protein
VTRDALEGLLRASLTQDQAAWLTAAMARASRGATDDLLRVYTEASRVLGRTPLASTASPAETTAAVPAHWTLEDVGRLLLLLARREQIADGDAFAEDALACFEQGDAREQQSWMRAVAWLPDAERYRPHVIDGCRTNILPLFQAVACDNPYPARYFPQLNFNQMVLKSLFNNVPLARIQGLAERANPELTRMAGDYAAERRAAGRSVPADIDLAMTAPAP